MNFTQETVSQLTGIPTIVVDRKQLPYEKEMHSIFGLLDVQINERKSAILKQIGDDAHFSVSEDLLMQMAEERGPWITTPRYDETNTNSLREKYIGSRRNSTSPFDLHFLASMAPMLSRWSNQTIAYGIELFGNSFRDLFHEFGKYDCRNAVIAPCSHLTDIKKELTHALNFNVQTENFEGVKSLLDLHEIGHSRFNYTFEDLTDCAKRHTNETIADCFAIKKYMEFGGAQEDVQTFIHMRRLCSFLGHSPIHYATAMACDDVLENKAIPFGLHLFYLTRNLQLRTHDELFGLAKDKTYDTSESMNVLDYKTNCFLSDVKANDCNINIFEYVPASSIKILQALDRALKTQNMSEETQIEGQKTLDAALFFCPDLDIPSRPKTKQPSLFRKYTC